MPFSVCPSGVYVFKKTDVKNVNIDFFIIICFLFIFLF